MGVPSADTIMKIIFVYALLSFPSFFFSLQPTTTFGCLVLLLESVEQLGRRLLTVALRVVLGPEPEILAGLLEITLGLPAQLLTSARRIGGQIQDVAGTARSDLVGKVATDGGREGLDHLVDSASATGSQVPGAHTRVVGAQVVQGEQVTVGQIQDVNVVTDGGTIAGLVVYMDQSVLIPGNRLATGCSPSPNTRSFSRLPVATWANNGSRL